MLHLIRIIMFVVYEQLPQSLLSTHFQKLFCLICISSSSILFPREVFFLCCFVFFPVAQKFPTLSPYPLSSYSGRLLKAFFFSHCCFVFWDMQICLSCPALFQTALQAEAVRLKLCKPTPPNTRATRCPTRNHTIQPIANKDTFTLLLWTPTTYHDLHVNPKSVTKWLCIHLVNCICDYITCFDPRLHLSTCLEPDAEHQIAPTGKATNLLKSCNELLNLCVSNQEPETSSPAQLWAFLFTCVLFSTKTLAIYRSVPHWVIYWGTNDYFQYWLTSVV